MSTVSALKIKSSSTTKLSTSRELKKSSVSGFVSKMKDVDMSSVKVTLKHNADESSNNEVKSKGPKKVKSGKSKKVVKSIASKLAEQNHIERIRSNIAVTDKKLVQMDVSKVKKGNRPISAPKPVKLTSSKVKRTASAGTIGKQKLAAKSTNGFMKVAEFKRERPSTVMSKLEVNKQVSSSSSKQIQKLQPSRPNTSIKRISTQATNPIQVKSEVVTKVKDKAKQKSSSKTFKRKRKLISKAKEFANIGIGELRFSPRNLSVSIKLKQPDAVGADKQNTGSKVEKKAMQDKQSSTEVKGVASKVPRRNSEHIKWKI